MPESYDHSHIPLFQHHMSNFPKDAVQLSQVTPAVAHATLSNSHSKLPIRTFNALNFFVLCWQGSSCRKVCAHITVVSYCQESAEWRKLAFTSICVHTTVKARSHSTPRLNHVQKIMKIEWTWSNVVIFGEFWLGRALYGIWPPAALPLLKHCLNTASHVQPRVRLKIGSPVFERRKKAAS